MGASWRDHPSFELVEQASEIAERDVAALLLDADQETLTNTANAQLATFVVEPRRARRRRAPRSRAAACAGHSLGEYTALVATGALVLRGRSLPRRRTGRRWTRPPSRTPGTMMAVLGLDDDAVEAACVRAEGEVWVANYNAPGQVVIAGERDSLDRAAEIAT